MTSRGYLLLGLGLMAILTLVGLMAISVLVGTGGALATVAEDALDDDNRPISGEARDKCITTALAEYPEGTVTQTEADDDDATYEVEVHLEGSSQVEVNLNRDCQVIGQETYDMAPTTTELRSEVPADRVGIWPR